MTINRSFTAFLTCAAFLTFAGALPGPLNAKDNEGGDISYPVPNAKPFTNIRAYTGIQQVYTTKYEDTLLKIARANNLGYVEIRAANPGIDPWLPGEGTDIVLPTRHLLPKAPHQGIVVNLPEMRLYAFLEALEDPVTYPIGIGRTGLKTPIGTTRIIKKKDKPTWFPTDRMREEDPSLPRSVGPGPDNPLGTHALYLGWPTFLIHGTSEPWGIGRRVSSGCIRLYPEDIVKLYDSAHEDMQVTIIDQPVKVGWIDNQLFIEAHVTQEHANDMEEEGANPPLEMTERDMRLILEEAGQYTPLLDWATIRQAISERRGVPIAITPEVQDIRQANKAGDSETDPI